MKPWNRLPREVVEALLLGALKVRLDQAVSPLIHLEMSLLTAEWLNQMTIKGPFHLK